MAAHILRDLAVHSVRLLTNNDTKAACLAAHGIKITERLPLLPPAHGGGDGGNGAGPKDGGKGGRGPPVPKTLPHFV